MITALPTHLVGFEVVGARLIVDRFDIKETFYRTKRVMKHKLSSTVIFNVVGWVPRKEVDDTSISIWSDVAGVPVVIGTEELEVGNVLEVRRATHVMLYNGETATNFASNADQPRLCIKRSHVNMNMCPGRLL
ncbi:ATP-dependent DNA helicase PIF1 [Pyrenophora tritici-repentis]|nr:ATP-dependent DNA helicase PIF1 [Pyrenophora tritici-repentis]KAI0604208.1 ATP-dependent DNA helicase PIF1 [Pyrenophora tritici-repentis]